MRGNTIGELEELVLLAVGSAYDEAYAVVILNIIKESTNRTLDVTAIHAVLRRLEQKGFLKSSMGGATNERGGRRKRYFTLSKSGRHVLDEIMEVRSSLYNKLPKMTFASI